MKKPVKLWRAKKWNRFDTLHQRLLPLKEQYARKAIKIASEVYNLENPEQRAAAILLVDGVGLHTSLEMVQPTKGRKP